jgi:hypothetical protein
MALEGGRVREVGDQALLSRGGLYSQLYRRQDRVFDLLIV